MLLYKNWFAQKSGGAGAPPRPTSCPPLLGWNHGTQTAPQVDRGRVPAKQGSKLWMFFAKIEFSDLNASKIDKYSINLTLSLPKKPQRPTMRKVGLTYTTVHSRL